MPCIYVIVEGPPTASEWRFICRFQAARIALGATRLAGPFTSGEEFFMLSEADRATSRRRFLQYLAASPLLATSDLAAFAAERPGLLPDPMLWAPRALDKLITNPKEAINVFDFEPVAFKNVPPAHFGYMASGIDD